MRNKLRNDKCSTTRAINLSVFVEKIDTTIAIKEQNDEPRDTAKQKQSNGLVVEVWCEVRSEQGTGVKCKSGCQLWKKHSYLVYLRQFSLFSTTNVAK